MKAKDYARYEAGLRRGDGGCFSYAYHAIFAVMFFVGFGGMIFLSLWDSP